MLQLAIECSGLHGSVALLRGEEVVGSCNLPEDRSSVQSLAVAVKKLLDQAAHPPNFISVTCGPGSFTGLRGGLTTAKMLGLAWNVPIVAVDTLEVLALQLTDLPELRSEVLIVPVINAFRRQVFVAAWQASSDGTFNRVALTQVIDADRWISTPLPPFVEAYPESRAGKILVAGPGLVNYRPVGRCPGTGLEVQIVDNVSAQAGWVGQIGWRQFQAGQVHTAASLAANYVRASAAEEKQIQ
jgi:tRNA threonylcarbamoyladenosine biosynthesis protein TsaB